MPKIANWKACGRCGGRAYWDPIDTFDYPNRRGTYTCLNCGREREETDEEVLARSGQPVRKAPEDRMREEIAQVRADFEREQVLAKDATGTISITRLENAIKKNAAARAANVNTDLSVYRAVARRP